VAKTNVVKSTGNLGKIGIAAEDLGALSQQNLARLNQVDKALLAGDEAKARALFQSLKESLDPQTAGRYEASLFETLIGSEQQAATPPMHATVEGR
jgi:hypothetical protein